MNFPYQTVGILTKRGYQGIEDITQPVAEWMSRNGSRLVCLEDRPVAGATILTTEQFEQSSELILVLGGDGTFLAGARLSLHHNIPVLGVNLGRLGFLTEISLNELFPALEKVKTGEVSFETRHLLHARVHDADQVVFESHVINDAVVAKVAIARLLELETRVNGNFLAVFKADGLIISTPTGSTAYSLAAGGPIVFPTMEALVMTPICPHSLNHRPLVIPDHFTITVHVQGPAENVSLTLDGQIGRTLQPGEYVEIAKSKFQLKMIKSPFKNYFDILKSKLRWGEI